MFSKKTKSVIALSLSFGVLSGGIDACIVNNNIAYGEEISSQDEGKEESNFNYAKEKLTKQLDAYEFSKDTTEADINCELGNFTYTTEGAVSIKAKDTNNFKNDKNTCSFDALLYEEDNINNTNNFTYSKEYAQSSEPQLNLNENKKLTTTASSLTVSNWTTDESLNNTYDVVTINGVKFSLQADGSLSVTGHTYDIPQNLELPDKITCLNGTFNVTSIGDEAFSSCRSLESIKIPEGITSIGDEAFFWCTSLESIKIPEGVTSIGNAAFYYCDSLKSIEIPEKVTSIGNYAFYLCGSLESIDVDLDNKNYASKDGVLFNKDLSKLINYPIGKKDMEYIIPGGVTSVGDNAFYCCKDLTSIEISESVTSIGEYAFSGCSSLKNIEIPEGITSIGSGIFNFCNKDLAALYYNVLDDNTIKITGVYLGKDVYGDDKTFIGENVIIPDTICGRKVTEIDDSIFNGCADKIKSITCYNPQIKEQFKKIPALKDITIQEVIDAKSINGDTTITYDGKPHSIVVKGAPEKTTIQYSESNGSDYTNINPEYSNPGKYTVYYKISGEGYEELTGSGILNIVKNLVSNITISDETKTNHINTKGGSLKLKGVVSPSDATISDLKWTIVSGEDLGSISEDGTLTANGTKNGTITVKAEATDGSGVVSNELTINVENQVSSSGGGSSSNHHKNKISTKAKDEVKDDTSIVINGNKIEEINNAFHNDKIKTITIDLSASNNENNSNGQGANEKDINEGPFLNEEIFNNLKNYPEKKLIIKNAVEDNSGTTIKKEDVEIQYTEDNHFKFIKNNAPLTGFIKIDNGEYAFDSNGIMETGWVMQETENLLYYFNKVTGKKEKGWIQDNNTWYYLDNETGAMKTGWIKDKGMWYHLNEQGKMDTGWFKDSDGNWYYLALNGMMAANTTIDGYKLGGNGAWI